MKKSAKSLTSELHFGAASGAPRVQDLVERVVALAKLSPTELAALLGTQAGADAAHVDFKATPDREPDTYLRSWDSIGHADPGALTDSEYSSFLMGERPSESLATERGPLEIYGAHLEH